MGDDVEEREEGEPAAVSEHPTPTVVFAQHWKDSGNKSEP